MGPFIRPIPAHAAIVLLVAPLALAGGGPVDAHTEQKGDIQVIHPWVQPGSSGHVSAYLTISNEGKSGITLTAAETPVARLTRIYRDKLPVDSVRVAPEDTIAGEEAGVHLHLIDLKRPLRHGDHIPITLHFSNGRDTRMTVRVVVGENTMMPNMGDMPGQGRRSQMPMHDQSQMPMGGGHRR